MTSGTSRPLGRLLGLTMATAIVVAACGGGAATPAPSVAPSQSAAASDAPSAKPDAAAVIAELKVKLSGTSLSVGSSASPNASVLGFFKTLQFLEEDFGVNVEEQLLDSDPLVAALISGQIQVGQLSLSGTASANNSGATFVAFGVNDQKNLFVVAAKAPTTTLEEVRGKTFGATQNLKQITGQTATKCLGSVGIDIEKDVELIRFNNTGEATAAIRSGQIVAGISATFRLTKIELEEPGAINILCYGLDENPSISSVWMGDRTWLEQNPDMALALILSELKSARWMKENRVGWIDLGMKTIEGYTAAAGAIDYDKMVVELDNWPSNGGLDKDLCDSTLATGFASGALETEVKCEDITDFSFQEKALEILGEE